MAQDAETAAVQPTRADIEAQIKELEAELEDLEHERNYVLKQTGVHIGAIRLKAMEEEYDRDAQRIREKIDKLRAEPAKA